MPEIPLLPIFGVETIAGRDERVLHPTRVSVRSAPHVPSLCLAIELNGHLHLYPMAMSTAHQLAKELRRGVREYLNGTDLGTG